MDFLVGHYTVLGVEFQLWILIVIGALAAYIVYFWNTEGQKPRI